MNDKMFLHQAVRSIVKRQPSVSEPCHRDMGRSWMDFSINPPNVLILNSFMCGIISLMLVEIVNIAVKHDLNVDFEKEL